MLAQGNRGYGLIHILVFSTLMGIISSTILSLIMNFNKSSKLEILNLKNSIRADHCLSGIYSLTTNSNLINGLETIHWYTSKYELNASTTQFLNKNSILKRIANSSPILETLNISLPILRRDTNSNVSSFSSPLKVTDFDYYTPTDSLITINPWYSVVVKAKQKRESLSGNGFRLTLLEKPKPILLFGSKNIEDFQEPLILDKSKWLAAIESYGLVYRTDKNTLEYQSLLTSDVQPMCEKLLMFSKIDSQCSIAVGESSINLEKRTFSCGNIPSSPLTRLNSLDIW